MKNVFKYTQKGLKEFFGYNGPINGEIKATSETALNKIHWLNTTGWDRERKALAYAQFRLNSEGADLKIDGLWGTNSVNAWNQFGPGGDSTVAAPNAETVDSSGSMPESAGWMPEIKHVPRWNHSSRPALDATGIVLHRTAGHFDTGDFAVGKWGHFSGPARTGKTLGFHFLVGKNESEVIQFCSIKKHVAHVRRWAASYVGIEISGDIGQSQDGFKNGEDLTPWQINTTVEIVKWVAGRLDIPMVEIEHQSAMFQQSTAFHGLVGHRDLSGNDHADSPNKNDWAKIMNLL